MEFGKFRLARTAGLFVLVILFSGLNPSAMAQQTPTPSGTQSAVPALPAAQPISQAALGSGSRSTTKAAENTSSAQIAPTDASPSVRLGPGDLIEVNVYNVPELSTKARVGNSGDVYLPLIDYLHVGGLTVEEAQGLMQKRLEDGGFVRSAHVTLLVDESASQGVTILGEVNRPGIYPAMGQRKLYDFISAAGGFSATAGRKVSIIRENSVSGAVTLNLP